MNVIETEDTFHETMKGRISPGIGERLQEFTVGTKNAPRDDKQLVAIYALQAAALCDRVDYENPKPDF